MLRLLVISALIIVVTYAGSCPPLDMFEDAVLHPKSQSGCGNGRSKTPPSGCHCSRWLKERDSNNCPKKFYVKCTKGSSGGSGRKLMCKELGKMSSYSEFKNTLQKYDVVLVGASWCRSTQATLGELNYDPKMKGRCAYIYYNYYQAYYPERYLYSWYKPMYRDVQRKGNMGLPFSFHCGRYVGGQYNILPVKHNRC